MIRIVALTEAGQRLGMRLHELLIEDSDLWFKPKPFSEKIQRAFQAGDALILICATGIAVRTLAPVINNKHEDPPVLVLDELGKFVVPLLSGHEGNANEWGRQVSDMLKSELVVTTAKPYLRPVYTVGMGCERDCPLSFLQSLLDQCLEQAGIEMAQITSINSIDIKTDEVGLLALANELKKPYRTYGKDELKTVEDKLSQRSEYVYKTVGVYGVAESAALLDAEKLTGQPAELVLVKQKKCESNVRHCTVVSAVKIDWVLERVMGTLFVIGAGPGDVDLLTPKAKKMIELSSDLVAYGLYLDLLGDLCAGKNHHDLPLGEEIGRARLALDLAASGKTTALISSGDIGIYAMATLVFELLDLELQGKETGSENSQAWLDVDIEVVPGISAMQAGAARVGALLGHDFCTISLSDLLTPWETIEKRLHSCGTGDFVVSFYNPKSKKRDWQINTARDILLQYRPAETPVLLGRQLTRDDESIRIMTLAELDAKDVDMFTMVTVGNSETRHIVNGEKEWAYTPRGYKKKL